MPSGSHKFCGAFRKEPVNELATYVYGIIGAPCYMGINEGGVCVGTTNLSTYDSGVGLPFPFTISRMLGKPTAKQAVEW